MWFPLSHALRTVSSEDGVREGLPSGANHVLLAPLGGSLAVRVCLRFPQGGVCDINKLTHTRSLLLSVLSILHGSIS